MVSKRSWLVVSALLGLGSSPLLAQTNVSYSDIVGYTTINVRAKTGAANALSFLSLNVHRPIAYSGLVSANSVNTNGRSVIQLSNSDLAVGQFTTNAVRHYLRVTSGANKGLISEVLSNSANSIEVQDNLSLVLSNNSSTFEVRPFWTLGSAFPSGGGLNGGTSATPADNLTIIDANGTSFTYFYNSSVGKWRRGNTDSDAVIVPPGSGILITRKQNTAVSIRLVGEVIKDTVQTDIPGGTRNVVSLVANPFPLASKTLAETGLYTGSSTTGLVGGTTATTADNLTIYDPSTGVANTYFYHTINNRWQRGGADSSSVVVPEGSAFVITRRANRPPFEWYIPSPLPINL